MDVLRIRGEAGIKFVRPMNPMNGLLDFITTGSGDMWHLANATSGQGHATKMLAYLTQERGRRRIVGQGRFRSGLPDLGSNKDHLEQFGQ